METPIAEVEIYNLTENLPERSAPWRFEDIKRLIINNITNDDIPVAATKENVVFAFPASFQPNPTIIVKITACCNSVYDDRTGIGLRVGKALSALLKDQPILVTFSPRTECWFFGAS